MSKQPYNRLTYNDPLTYAEAFPAGVNHDAPRQDAQHGPYTGKIVDFTDSGCIGVRADGWWGNEPLYYVYPSAILDTQSDTTSNEKE